MKTGYVALVLVAGLLAGCKTTEEAARSMRSDWVGRSTDSFFSAYGPPETSFDLDSGGRVFTWRGGEATSYQPGRYQTNQVSHLSATGQIQRSTVTTYQPPRRQDFVCEAQITADARGIIENIRISRDTDGRGLSLSRCAELFTGD